MEKVSHFFDDGSISWKNLCGICTDGAPAMLGSRSDFQKKVKDLAPDVKGTHCLIHRYALTCKTLPADLELVLDSVVKAVNFIKPSSLNEGQFQEFYTDMDSTHQKLLLHTAVSWLSKGTVLDRFFEL